MVNPLFRAVRSGFRFLKFYYVIFFVLGVNFFLCVSDLATPRSL